MNITAKIIEIFETTNVTDSFKKREFVVEYSDNPQFVELIKFELIQDKCELLNGFKKGEEIEIQFNLKGRKWTDPKGVDKYFNTLQAWRLDKKGEGAANHNADVPTEEPGWPTDQDDNENELPF